CRDRERLSHQRERMVLACADRAVFVAVLLDPPAPSPELIAALKWHRALFG
ncbi:MAG: DUF1778 domain-containing protein, partial [Alphaproteobacteria bacterium]|nr:DUF1778 domain-containing protein [Alphaproteobacteria bacterium]